MILGRVSEPSPSEVMELVSQPSCWVPVIERAGSVRSAQSEETDRRRAGHPEIRAVLMDVPASRRPSCCPPRGLRSRVIANIAAGRDVTARGVLVLVVTQVQDDIRVLSSQPAVGSEPSVLVL